MRSHPITFTLLLGGALTFGAWSNALGGVVYVNQGRPAGPPADGHSWATAFTTVQAGLNAAVPDDEIWVARGTYLERIIMKAGVRAYGGFVGTETALSQRNWTNHQAILDGNLGGSVVTIPADTTNTTRLDGFVVQNGNAAMGGGIFCTNGSPVIANSLIRSNLAGGSSFGAGAYFGSSFAVISNNWFTANRIPGYTPSPDDWSGWGGGLACRFGAPLVTGNVFLGNMAGVAGGIEVDTSSAVVSNNLVYANLAEDFGAGIECFMGSPVVTRNRIIGNTSTAFGFCKGAGISCWGNGNPSIRDNHIAMNEAHRNFGYGGGIFCQSQSRAQIINNTLAGNLASTGGGIYCEGSQAVLVNNLIATNSSGVQGVAGLALTNNCVFGNTGGNFAGITDPTGSNGNISVDPLLQINPLAIDFHLKTNSPCRDAGVSSTVLAGEVDIDGQPRIQGNAVDIGADETDDVGFVAVPRIIRVSPTGNDANDGSSWGAAKQTIQAALDLVSLQGGEVWVAAGNYRQRPMLRLFAYLYGGFSGTETERSQRDWARNVSVLDGDRAGSVVTAKWMAAPYAALSGFTIQNGKAASGGGISCRNAAPTLANNRIVYNEATFDGGGIDCGGPAAILNNLIAGNRATGKGGGIYLWNSQANALIANNTLIGNSAAQGGGIYADNSAPIVANNVIVSGSSGIAISMASLPPTLRNNCLYNNSGGNYIGLSAGTGDISADPFGYSSPVNFHITTNSPCYNAGDTSVVQPDWLDAYGRTRVQAGVVDIGAFEAGTADEWIPAGFVPATEITTVGGITYARTTLQVDTPAARLVTVLPVTRQGAVFSRDLRCEINLNAAPSGPLVLDSTSPLGALVAGNYAFQTLAWGISVNTNVFTVSANPGSTFGAPASMNGGSFEVPFLGVSGVDYVVQASTNLTSWTSIATNRNPPFVVTDSEAKDHPQRFYRLLIAP